MNNFDELKLENQLCFPLYACSKEIVKKYRGGIIVEEAIMLYKLLHKILGGFNLNNLEEI